MTDDLKDQTEIQCQAFKPERDFDRGERSPGYVRFKDLNNAEIVVISSSAAMRHCVRVVVREDLTASPLAKWAGVHLCRGMAVELIAALQRFLDEPVDDGLHCEWTHRIRRLPVYVEWYSTEPDENTGDFVGPVPGVKRGEEPGSGSWQHVFMVEATGTDARVYGSSATFAETSLQSGIGLTNDMCYKGIEAALRHRMMDAGVW